MEKAAEELETKFQETEKRLDTVAWKVDKLISPPTVAGETLSTCRLLAKLQEVKEDFKSVTAEVEQLRVEQKTTMTSIIAEIKEVMNSTDTLKDKLNMPKEADS